MRPRYDIRLAHPKLGKRLRHFFRWRATVARGVETIDEVWATAHSVGMVVAEDIPAAIGVGEWAQKTGGQVQSVTTRVDTILLLGRPPVQIGDVITLAGESRVAYQVTATQDHVDLGWVVCTVRAWGEIG